MSKQIILASGSPRRRQLLEYIIPDIKLAEIREIDESFPSDLAAEEVAPFLSRVKAEGYKDLLDEETLLITADTVVVLDEQILGKPKNETEAISELMKLSGKTHRVVTGVTISTKEKTVTFKEITEVTFDNVEEKDVKFYVSKFRPFDKAGAYGIQEWIGYIGITGINGCYYNVMGLPLHSLYRHLTEEFNYDGSTSK